MAGRSSIFFDNQEIRESYKEYNRKLVRWKTFRRRWKKAPAISSPRPTPTRLSRGSKYLKFSFLQSINTAIEEPEMLPIIFKKNEKNLDWEKLGPRSRNQDTAKAPEDCITNNKIGLLAQVKSEVYGTGWGGNRWSYCLAEVKGALLYRLSLYYKSPIKF